MKNFLSLTGFTAVPDIFQPTNQYRPPIISIANVDASNTTINAINHDGGSSPNVHSSNPPNPNGNISAPPSPPLPEFHSVVRVISKYQSNHYSMCGSVLRISVPIDVETMMEKGKIHCTLWEEFATQLVKHMEEQPTTEYILTLQFAKFNLFKGTMGISNTNHNSIMHINADFQEVKDFQKSLIMSGVPSANQVTQIVAELAYSLEEDLINNSIYKPISELKETFEKNGWWHKSCKQCFTSLKEAENSYHCAKCNSHPLTHTPRYSINMKVANDTDTTIFLLYDKEASRYLGISASDLRLTQLTKGGVHEEYPTELNALVGKKFLFKLIVKMEDVNAFQPYKIVVAKLCEEDSVMNKFLEKNNIHEDTSAPSAENSMEVPLDAFSTPKSKIITGGWSKKLIDVYPEDLDASYSKCRKATNGDNATLAKVHHD
ncbi:hypothetical protein Ahy_B09g095945 isoform A [Arachis hypogaea]|uniref:Replication factor A C-terminal domain-containing protein n=2 Tax=Arachis hypogaea TaxID=3818 RepID=A0A444XI84_ARAHY|nr:hypothetical protein Ahy_B09g095945 isoform A [Arachis hypogaea]